MDQDRPNTIRPGIVTSTNETIYPTGDEWILAFALKGCQWAIDLIESGKLAEDHARKWAGENI